MDITDLDKVKEVASNAEQERRILEQERKRLRVEAADGAIIDNRWKPVGP
jgi:hypothetical protein